MNRSQPIRRAIVNLSPPVAFRSNEMSDRVIPWVSRAVLMAAFIVLTLISRKFIGHPVDAAAASGITLGSKLAVTTMRASFGAFPLGCALFVLLCLVASSLRATGLVFV